MKRKFGSTRALAHAIVLALVSSLVLVPAAHAARPKCFGKRATIVGTNGSDEIRGTRRADVIVTKGGSDIVIGRGGNDRICTGGGNDGVSGGGGNDKINTGRGRDEALGGRGDDRIKMGGGSDAALGGGGADRIFLEGGSEEFADAGGGNDVIDLGPGIFQFAIGGPGNDEIIGFSPESGPTMDFAGYPEAPGPVTVDLEAGTATGHGTDTLVSIDGVEGSQFDDVLTGTAGSNFMFGLGGNDTITSGGNAGALDSPETVDQLLFDFLGGDAGNDSITGGSGLNVIVHDLAMNGVDVDLQAGTSVGDGNDTLSDIQVVLGTQFDDTLSGDNGDNLFEGEGGTDTIDGRAGSDTIGLIDALSGDVDLGAGTSEATYVPFDPITFEPGDPVTATSTLAGIENIWGSAGDDTLTGDDGANRIFGNPGSDDLFGLAGDDFLDGGPDFNGAVNTLDGGDGTDTCLNGTPTNCEAQMTRVSRRIAGTGLLSFANRLSSLRRIIR